MIFTIEVGRLYWNTVRDYLKQRQFHGDEVKWIESSGWLEREFTINGPAQIRRDLERWAHEVNIVDTKGPA